MLSQFKEYLPEWSYNIIIFAIYVVFIAILVVLVVMLIRLALGDWFTKLRRWLKTRKENRHRVIELISLEA